MSADLPVLRNFEGRSRGQAQRERLAGLQPR